MKVAGGAHLTYCTNIHPGETLEEVEALLETGVAAVRRGLASGLGPTEPMGVGLRLSARAAFALEQPGALAAFAARLARLGLYVFTLNGFPYGTFHGAPVKDRVYLPDWRDPERLRYSDSLARILAALLPEKIEGSISTVPGAYRAHLGAEEDGTVISSNLARHAVSLDRLRRETGRSIVLALEPEPGCLMESAEDAVAFFRDVVLGPEAIGLAAALGGRGREEAEALLRRHIGLCLDACHAAIAFDDPAEMMDRLRRAGIVIAKLQLSAGIEAVRPGAAERAALRPFAEDVYLHQVTVWNGKGRNGQGMTRHADLADALASPATPDGGEEEELWRIHFHVPLWMERLDGFRTTAPWLEELLALHRRQPVSSHLEVETYSWSVLDPRFRPPDLPAAIVRELEWVLERLS